MREKIKELFESICRENDLQIIEIIHTPGMSYCIIEGNKVFTISTVFGCIERFGVV